MTTYIVQGKLGAGKGKFCVDVMRQALCNGCRVATNVDLFLDKLMSANSRKTAIRLPDKPSAQDLLALGFGGDPEDRYNEDKYGVLVLDEAGSWFNSRQFMDKGRQALIEWLVHARKWGWHVYLQVQDLSMIDKQFRTGLAEMLVRCINASKMRLPVVGWVLGKRGRLPRFHIANFSHADVPGVVMDKEFFRGDDLHQGYDTLQKFRDDYPHGVHSLLSAWHLVGRHQQGTEKQPWWAFFGASRVKPVMKQKIVLVQRLQRLPPDRALYWSARLAREGLL